MTSAAVTATTHHRTLASFLTSTAHDLRQVLHHRDDKHQRTVVTAVLGNEGGDMDSVVCSIYAALALDRGLLPPPSSPFNNEPPRSRLVVPLLNFPREDLVLRGDVASALATVGVASPFDTLWSAVDAPEVLEAADELFLVDHNRLRPSQRTFEHKVIGVIDHHADERAPMRATQPLLRVVEPCGSAASLLVREIWRHFHRTAATTSMGDEPAGSVGGVLADTHRLEDVATDANELCAPTQPPGLAVEGRALLEQLPSSLPLLLAPIVLDTMNFDPAMQKVTAVDTAAAAAILGLPHPFGLAEIPEAEEKEERGDAGTGAMQRAAVPLPPRAATIAMECRLRNHHVSAADVCAIAASTTPLYKTLVKEKNNVSTLTVAQNLRRDFKAFEVQDASSSRPLSLGFAAWVEGADAVVQRHSAAALESEFSAFCRERELDSIVVLFAYSSINDRGENDGTFRREVLYYVPTSTTTAAVESSSSSTAADAQTVALVRKVFHGPSKAVGRCGFSTPSTSFTAQAFATHSSSSRGGTWGFVEQSETSISRKGLVPMVIEAAASSSVG